MDIWVVGTLNELFIGSSQTDRSILYSPLSILKLAAYMIVLYGNDAVSILVLSTKKQYSSFLKKVFIFQKICFKVQVLKNFKLATDCHIKTCRSLKQGAISKIHSTAS